MIQKSGYEAVIGIEIHVQLNTKEKIFCFCKNEITIEPNKNICEICCGYPGTLPVLNEEVIEKAIMAGLATNCVINKDNEFDRKHYFYADLPKGYQITQNYFPICEYGFITIEDEEKRPKKIRIRRIHIEEDAGKNIHTDHNGSLVDYNRAGTPLLEIVSYPDICSAYEASEYLKQIHQIMVFLEITSGNMEEGAFRADTNISVRKLGDPNLGTKCELKNINSFKFIKDATEYEINRQIDLLESGEKIIQQTRLWDTKLKQTYSMRNKETAADYRYLPDPDLSKIKISEKMITEIQNKLPELPQKKKERFINEYNLSPNDAQTISENKAIANYFEQTYTIIPSKLVSTWLLRELLKIWKENNSKIEEHHFSPSHFAELISLLDKNEITAKIGQDILQKTFISGILPNKYAQENNLIGNNLTNDEIMKIIQDIFEKNKESVKELREGKTKVQGYLIGKIMAETKGKASPQIINQLFELILKL